MSCQTTPSEVRFGNKTHKGHSDTMQSFLEITTKFNEKDFPMKVPHLYSSFLGPLTPVVTDTYCVIHSSTPVIIPVLTYTLSAVLINGQSNCDKLKHSSTVDYITDMIAYLATLSLDSADSNQDPHAHPTLGSGSEARNT